MLGTALAEAFTAAAIYALVHELLHAVVALLLGAQPRLGVSRDGLLPSPSIHVGKEELGRWERAAILYAPYMFNLLLMVSPVPLVMRLIAALTLPNALLEEENGRRTRLVVAVVLLFAVSLTAMFLLK